MMLYPLSHTLRDTLRFSMMGTGTPMIFFPFMSRVITRRVAKDADRRVTESSTDWAATSDLFAAPERCSSSDLDLVTEPMIWKNSCIRASIFSFRRSLPCSASLIWAFFFISSIRVGCTGSTPDQPSL